MREEWTGFSNGAWTSEVNVRDFIQKNYTPYDGDASFLAGPTQNTTDYLSSSFRLCHRLQKSFPAPPKRVPAKYQDQSSLPAYRPGSRPVCRPDGTRYCTALQPRWQSAFVSSCLTLPSSVLLRVILMYLLRSSSPNPLPLRCLLRVHSAPDQDSSASHRLSHVRAPRYPRMPSG